MYLCSRILEILEHMSVDINFKELPKTPTLFWGYLNTSKIGYGTGHLKIRRACLRDNPICPLTRHAPGPSLIKHLDNEKSDSHRGWRINPRSRRPVRSKLSFIASAQPPELNDAALRAINILMIWNQKVSLASIRRKKTYALGRTTRNGF